MLGCVCPHPPLLIPQIGGDRRDVQSTVDAMEQLAGEVGTADLAVVVSPHTPGFGDAVAVRSPLTLSGDFGRFRCPQVGLRIENDVEFVDRLVTLAAGAGGLDIQPVDDDELDHGVLVPFFFLKARRLVSLSVMQSYDRHKDLGRLIAECADELGREVLFVASGDLSHRLIPGAPAGYDRRGAEFDRQVVDAFAGGDLSALDGLDRGLVHGAGECGLRSFIALGAFLEASPTAVKGRVLSYEGPFGVGYAVAAFEQAA
ncbi:MAG TPA: class III extradiol dioxygenase subunit B-like domain-containing protein [Thermoleophilia bacterium]|nr:class III extradiol dioxygenase subunit B-like domain-containing protein [Thermoleophilia bacterium]